MFSGRGTAITSLLAGSGEDACLPCVLLQATSSSSFAVQLGASSCRDALFGSHGNAQLLLIGKKYFRPE